MIQRIQSLFLLLAAAAMGGLFALPLASSDVTTANLLADKVYSVQDHAALMGLAGLGALLAVIAVFLFKNRGLQKRVGYLTIVFSILFLVVAYVLFTNDAKGMSESAVISDQMGMYLPFASIILVFIANYFIGKDDKLVNSMDRLR